MFPSFQCHFPVIDTRLHFILICIIIIIIIILTIHIYISQELHHLSNFVNSDFNFSGSIFSHPKQLLSFFLFLLQSNRIQRLIGRKNRNLMEIILEIGNGIWDMGIIFEWMAEIELKILFFRYLSSNSTFCMDCNYSFFFLFNDNV